MLLRSKRLIRILRQLDGRQLRGAELGVFQGQNAAALLRVFPTLTLYLVDNWAVYGADHAYRKSADPCAAFDAAAQKENFTKADQATSFARERRIILNADTLTAARSIPPASLDFVFVDADHTFAAVQADLAAWFPKLKIGGIFCGHDYDHPSDRRGTWGVRRAVDAFAREHRAMIQTAGSTIWWTRVPADQEPIGASNP